MKHALSGQASPEIPEIETLGAKTWKDIMGKADYRHFGVLTYLNLGRKMMSGGAYEEMSGVKSRYREDVGFMQEVER